MNSAECHTEYSKAFSDPRRTRDPRTWHGADAGAQHRYRCSGGQADILVHKENIVIRLITQTGAEWLSSAPGHKSGRCIPSKASSLKGGRNNRLGILSIDAGANQISFSNPARNRVRSDQIMDVNRICFIKKSVFYVFLLVLLQVSVLYSRNTTRISPSLGNSYFCTHANRQ